ncbi:MAG TPA: DNA mismatch repair protein MutS [Candidatus Marinimicrobia bacterium]|nr:DNA mismatch repair protein MutS [Candidatus Neomarinimicrobiota bacterium]HPB00418.1 DNA mismatch repair protein MutS [Candidatus Neomarinimicrobiota bacterium]HPN74982.1 DNA mismatch repair protein MutS [Candidatus Neomarinimicrobiota bacterium]HQE95727.1 DNA mismatch repair protein MutS [Candidatus Neomarinimicrobiota bacterium]HQK11604.1 DNA mismatch repair protein MutS [Candidatus Neomarinimicrobiota bacterium]
MTKSTEKIDETTPVMRQYNAVKAQYPDALVLFRMGDFYETFREDAKQAAKILNITLTKRANGKAAAVPLAGFPYHALESYLHKLLKAGLKVAICEQVEDPKLAKGVVKRAVVEIITPGTAISDRFLEKEKNNYLVSVYINGENAGLAALDISTGEFYLSEIPTARITEAVLDLHPAEIICPESIQKEIQTLFTNQVLRITPLEDWIFTFETAYQTLIEHFKTDSLKGFGCQSAVHGITAAGPILHYLRQNYQTNLQHIYSIRNLATDETVLIDDFTRRNLEIFQTMQSGDRKGTLMDVIDQTVSPMGVRLLTKWLIRPLRDPAAINQRLDGVEFLYNNTKIRHQLREMLAHCGDLERLISRLSTNRASAREIVALKNTLKLIPGIRDLLPNQLAFSEINSLLNPLPELVELLERAIKDEDLPLSIHEGGFIKDGYSAELDEYRHIARHGKEWIARLQETERQKLGIPSLKVGYNKVFGYYIEVTRTHAEKIPPEYIRKQTLVNNERFVTPELKEYEEKLLNAEERINQIEFELFQDLRTKILQFIEAIQKNAGALAQIDVLAGLAELAEKNRYCRPVINDGTAIDIKAGRHPVVEHLLPPGEKFIANDLHIDNLSEQILIITGPNMAGKSTYLRQIGLIVLMAQIGSFVPADSATIGVVDKIFTRVGASDNLAAGESTFLMEMHETANILNNVTPHSLVLLDEIGRGTSTYDGMAIAWSVTEYLHNQPNVAAKTLFATHYHELTELEKILPRLKNYNVAVREYGDRVIFLRKIVPGGCDKSYGIHVAQMAGVPPEVIGRAREILTNLSPEEKVLPTNREKFRHLPEKDANQLGLFGDDLKLKKMLAEVDIDNLTPLEALQKLAEIKKSLGG